MNFTSARRHDSRNFLYAVDGFGRNTFGLSPKNVCLDSAHDNIPTYELLGRRGMNTLIDINGRAKSSRNAPDGVTLTRKAIRFAKRATKCTHGGMTLSGTRTNTAAR